MGRWSTCTSRSTASRPSADAQPRVTGTAGPSADSAGRRSASTPARTCPTRVDLPDPDTPVTAVSTPSGNVASTPRTLCRSTPPRVIHPVGTRGSRAGAGSSSKRNRRVADPSTPARPAGGPLCRTRPPCSPASGPTSTSQSARRTTSIWCSTTNTELPASLSLPSTPSSDSVSAGCRPADGSSSTYTTPNSPDRSCVASRSRCSSPEDRVGAVRSRLRYPRPSSVTGSILASRSAVSTRAVSLPPPDSSSTSVRAVSGSATSSAIVRPAKVTASASRRSLPPPHTGQGALVRNRSAFARRVLLLESANVCITCRRALMYVPW